MWRMPWRCNVCTYVNEKETFLACEMCQTPRGSKKRSRSTTEDTERKQKKMKTIELGGSTTEDESDDDVVIVRDSKDRTSKMPWKLIRFHGIGKAGNQDSLSLRDIVSVPGKLNFVVLATFDADMNWLLQSWPELKSMKRVVFIHGMESKHHEQFQDESPAHFEIVSRCPKYLTCGKHPRTGNDVTFFRGCHHTKFMMLGFEGGMRFVIHTAALGCSFNMSTQGAYVQDFPIKKSMNSSSGAFENTLIEYCKSYEEAGRNLYFRDKEPKLFQGLSMEPKCWPGLSTDRKMKLSEMVACFDFSSARGHLLASVRRCLIEN